MTDNFSYLSSFSQQICECLLWVDIGNTALNKVDNPWIQGLLKIVPDFYEFMEKANCNQMRM